MTYKTALVTGGAIRIGKDICKKLHENGYNIICLYNKSEDAAKALKSELNESRKFRYGIKNGKCLVSKSNLH